MPTPDRLDEAAAYTDVQLNVSSPAGSLVVVAISGELDHSGASYARAFIDQHAEPRPEHLILDLSQVSFLASAGLHLLLDVQRVSADSGAALHLVGLHGNRAVTRVLEVTGMTELFEVHSTLADLLAHLGGGGEH